MGSSTDWRGILSRQLPRLGHRNWIAVVDSAYPSQSSSSIETVVTRADQVEVLRHVIEAVDAAPHVRPIFLLDSELAHLQESDAPGIAGYRSALAQMLDDREMQFLPHEEIIQKLAQAATDFQVIVLKTTFTLPYTSLFIQLDCAYWSAESERKLRAALNHGKRDHPER